MTTNVPIHLNYLYSVSPKIYVLFLFLRLSASGNTPCDDPVRLTSYDDNYICVCTNGWTGLHCGIDVDECSSSPCEDLTSCRNLAGSYECYYPLYMIVPLSIGASGVTIAVLIFVCRRYTCFESIQ